MSGIPTAIYTQPAWVYLSLLAFASATISSLITLAIIALTRNRWLRKSMPARAAAEIRELERHVAELTYQVADLEDINAQHKAAKKAAVAALRNIPSD